MAWRVDPKQTKIEFLVRHLMVTNTRGRFLAFDGTLDMNEENPQASSVEGTVEIASLDTGISMRNRSLMAARSFDAEQFPTMTFASTEVGEFHGDRFELEGNLTIKGITRPVVLNIHNKGHVPSEDGQRRYAFGATFVVSRADFDIRFMAIMDIGGLFVADEIHVELELVFIHE